MRLIEKDSFCPLCGRDETSKRIGYTSFSSVTENYVSHEGEPEIKHTRYYAAVCLKCGGMLLYSSEGKNPVWTFSPEDENTFDGENDRNYNDFAKAELLYPVPVWLQIKNKLPPEIAEKYEIAIKIKGIHPNGFAGIMREILEKVCNHYKIAYVNKRGYKICLHQRLEAFFKLKILPKELEEMVMLMKDFGNRGVHEGNIKPQEVTKMETYFNLVLQYLFETRQDLEELRKNP